MKIGIVSMYPYRPHVQDLVYLSNQLEDAGHECSFLSCKASLPTCYYNLFKGEVKSKKQCLKCEIGGFSSYTRKSKIFYINRTRKAELNQEDIDYLINSTIGSLGRIENESEIESVIDEETKSKLVKAVEIVYQNTIDWITKEGIEGVLVFNGRLDVTRAIILSLNRINTPFISVENHLNGITLNYNADCLSLDFINEINERYKDSYLDEEQAAFSGKIIGEMFLKKQKLWRTHNISNTKSTWPIKKVKTKKLLITPSSKYEFLGNKDWEVYWTQDYTEGYQKVIEKLGIEYSDCVLRCHPFWHENLGSLGKGNKSEKHYTEWAKKLGIHVIGSEDDVNTLDLINEAEIVLVNGGTAGIEAAILGKKVVSVGKSRYYKAGFTFNVFNNEDVEELIINNADWDSNLVQKRVLRYLYNYHARFEQFYDTISKQNALKNNYANSKKVADSIIGIFQKRSIDPYVQRYGQDGNYEDEIIKHVNKKDWSILVSAIEDQFTSEGYEIKKRGLLKIVDSIRDKLPAGHY